MSSLYPARFKMQACTAARFVIALLLAATFTAAAPQPKRKSNGVAIPLSKRSSSTLLHPDNTVNFAAVDAHAASVTSKILRGLDNYEENTGTTHPSVLEYRGPLKRDGGLALSMYNDIFWHGIVSIGSPPKEFDVAIDTGSADLFVKTDNGGRIMQGRTVWDPSLSNTAKDLDLRFEITFGNGDTASGKQYTDNVTVAGFTADKQVIGAATRFIFMGTPAPPVDGMLGLAFQSISDFSASPLFETLISENKVADPIFSFKLSSSGGELFIGATNEALYQKDTLTYVDVTVRGYWQIKMDQIEANGQTIASEVDVLIDSGANFIFGDKVKVYNLHQALGGKHLGAGQYCLPCRANPEPSVTLKFGGRMFKIPVETLRFGPIEPGSPYCFSNIMAQAAPISLWSIGAPFLQGVYTVFDYGSGPEPTTPRVGFANLA